MGLNDSALETIEYGDAAEFVNMVSVNLSGSCFDLSEGTPEKVFVDAMTEITADKEDIITQDPTMSNLALGATVVSSNNINRPEVLFDGKNSGNDYSNAANIKITPAEVIVDLGSEETVENYSLVNYYSETYAPKGLTISYSNDLQSWIPVDTVTDNNQLVIDRYITPVSARFFKM